MKPSTGVDSQESEHPHGRAASGILALCLPGQSLRLSAWIRAVPCCIVIRHVRPIGSACCFAGGIRQGFPTQSRLGVSCIVDLESQSKYLLPCQRTRHSCGVCYVRDARSPAAGDDMLSFIVDAAVIFLFGWWRRCDD